VILLDFIWPNQSDLKKFVSGNFLMAPVRSFLRLNSAAQQVQAKTELYRPK
jgi:hypothetical protein